MPPLSDAMAARSQNGGTASKAEAPPEVCPNSSLDQDTLVDGLPKDVTSAGDLELKGACLNIKASSSVVIEKTVMLSFLLAFAVIPYAQSV